MGGFALCCEVALGGLHVVAEREAERVCLVRSDGETEAGALDMWVKWCWWEKESRL